MHEFGGGCYSAHSSFSGDTPFSKALPITVVQPTSPQARLSGSEKSPLLKPRHRDNHRSRGPHHADAPSHWTALPPCSECHLPLLCGLIPTLFVSVAFFLYFTVVAVVLRSWWSLEDGSQVCLHFSFFVKPRPPSLSI